MSPSQNRPESSVPPLQPREMLLVMMLSVCLVWTTWTLGGIRLWGQCGTFLLSLGCFAVAIAPMNRDWSNAKALLRFIPFWLGLFVASYICVQGLNSAWSIEEVGDAYKVHKLAHIDWLPTGVSTPWWAMNPWRMLLIFAPCWLVVCAVWCGSQRPKAMRALLWVVSVNAVAFAIIGILEAISGTLRMLWLFEAPVHTAAFWGTISNPNHASAFMNLGLASSLGLFLYYTGRQGRDLAKGGKYLMLLPFSVVILAGVFQAMSRAGIVLAGLIVGAFLFILFLRFVRSMREGNAPKMILAGVLLIVVLGGVAASTMKSAVDFNVVRREMKSLIAVAGDPEKDTRYYLDLASMELYERHPAYGWGAGCYRYFIGITKKNHPELKIGDNWRILYAHNEYTNSLCDIGLVGSLPLFVGVFCLPLYVLAYRRKGVDGGTLLGIVGLGAVLLHAAFEFFFQHPLVSLQFALVLAAFTRMAALRHVQRTRGPVKELKNP